ncbi:MAG: prephenate dehydrogenase/arogenate dehydrogenase family protein, partial [Sphingobacteriia bacterium]
MNIAIIGTGLIGGSMALALRAKGFASHIIGVENNRDNAIKAVALGLVDKCLELDEAIAAAELIILATPINTAEQLLPLILDKVNQQVVFDVGSTKKSLCDSVAKHPNRGRFVATHPMWGTENSGPS